MSNYDYQLPYFLVNLFVGIRNRATAIIRLELATDRLNSAVSVLIEM